jgi:uncharacterized membrane protein
MVILLTPALLIHTLAAAAALVVRMLVLLDRRGGARYRSPGRARMNPMLAVALRSYAIRADEHLAWLHLLSLVTLAGLAGAVRPYRARRIGTHRALVAALDSRAS